VLRLPMGWWSWWSHTVASQQQQQQRSSADRPHALWIMLPHTRYNARVMQETSTVPCIVDPPWGWVGVRVVDDGEVQCVLRRRPPRTLAKWATCSCVPDRSWPGAHPAGRPASGVDKAPAARHPRPAYATASIGLLNRALLLHLLPTVCSPVSVINISLRCPMA
jgi:hypothetical protein